MFQPSICLDRMDSYVFDQTNLMKDRGLKPIDIEEETGRIRQAFIANGLFYDPRKVQSDLTETDPTPTAPS